MRKITEKLDSMENGTYIPLMEAFDNMQRYLCRKAFEYGCRLAADKS